MGREAGDPTNGTCCFGGNCSIDSMLLLCGRPITNPLCPMPKKTIWNENFSRKFCQSWAMPIDILVIRVKSCKLVYMLIHYHSLTNNFIKHSNFYNGLVDPIICFTDP